MAAAAAAAAAASKKRLLVVDCDCGVDDALGLLLVLAHRDLYELVAITCCYGNVTVDNVCNNVRKVLQLCNELEVPVYRGCERPLVKTFKVEKFHGTDGFGDVGSQYPHDGVEIAPGHASIVLSQLAREYRHSIHLAVLGPMTNIALAHRLDPSFTRFLKSIHFMGGNVTGAGNTSSAAEFNFMCDPESAHIIVTEARCPLTMIPWETTLNHGVSWDLYEKLYSSGTTRSIFLKNITKARLDLCKRRGNPSFLDCDFLAIAALIDPEVIQEEKKCVLKDNVFVIEGESSEQSDSSLVAVLKFDNDLLNNLRELITLDKAV